MKSWRFYLSLFAMSFFAGILLWKLFGSSQRVGVRGHDDAQSQKSNRFDVVMVGDQAITQDDIEFEFKLHTEGVFDAETLTPSPNLGEKYDEELNPLRSALTRTMIERLVLYKHIRLDKTFNSNDPARLKACLEAWQETLALGLKFLQDEANKQRLKSRLCEQSIVEQYLEERVLAQVDVFEREIVEYFKNNRDEFSHEERVIISQIVLPDEGKARQVMNLVRNRNFHDLAREHSIAPEGEQGGKLGPFDKQSMPRLFDVAFSMRPGQISDIIKSNYGFHIIRLEDRIKKRELSLQEATETIRKKILQNKRDGEYKKWVELALNTISVNPPRPL
jgi:peptidyl-prolyl cis-trans isomerase C